MLLHLLPRAFDRVLLAVQQVLHQQHQLDLLPLVHAISRPILGRIEKLELAFPIAKDVWLEVGDLTDLANRVELLNRFGCAHASCSARSPRALSCGMAWL